MSAALRPSSSTLRVLRQRSTFVQRRFASSSTENAEKKAKETLAAAQKQAEKAWESASKYMGPLGERAGSLLGCESLSRFVPDPSQSLGTLHSNTCLTQLYF